MQTNRSQMRPAGYSRLITLFKLEPIPCIHCSFVSNSGKHSLTEQDGVIEEIYPVTYWPGEKAADHLEFALKYDGVELALLKQIFEHFPLEELTAYIKSKPTGKYTRRIWFLYEFLTGKRAPVNDLKTGNYINVLETKKYYTLKEGSRSTRHRVMNNLPGPASFCPIVRKTKNTAETSSTGLQQQCKSIIASYPAELLHRALNYLYNKETKSSFEIEQIKPHRSRTEKFITALQLAEKEDFCRKSKLIELQNLIVDPRFQDNDYRKHQNYVGQTFSYSNEIIHYIPPKPEDLPDLMSGLIECHRMLQESDISPVVHAAIISYGFVFLHPFEDGNGRIHRFLIHNILSMREAVPRGLMFPVSAVMLKNPLMYDASLEAFSRPLLKLVDYQLDESGEMTVENDTSILYQYMNMTPQVEALTDFIDKTITEELSSKLDFLNNYDKTAKAVQEIVDMPDRLINRFIQLCLQNNSTLSEKKRSAHFSFLTESE